MKKTSFLSDGTIHAQGQDILLPKKKENMAPSSHRSCLKWQFNHTSTQHMWERSFLFI